MLEVYFQDILRRYRRFGSGDRFPYGMLPIAQLYWKQYIAVVEERHFSKRVLEKKYKVIVWPAQPVNRYLGKWASFSVSNYERAIIGISIAWIMEQLHEYYCGKYCTCPR